MKLTIFVNQLLIFHARGTLIRAKFTQAGENIAEHQPNY